MLPMSVEAQDQFSVYFDSNKFTLTAKESARLAEWAKANSGSKVIGAHGFCDEDGSSAMNDTLAKNRVKTIYQFLQNQVQFRADFSSRSFGELHKMSANKAENRRVTLFYLQQKDLSRENELVGIVVPETKVVEPKPIIPYPTQLVFENPDGSKSTFELNQEFMQTVTAAKLGDKILLKDLNFVINTFMVENRSKAKLYELLVVMQRNPELKIEIQGHLCCMPSDKQDLSTQRAKAIKNFLLLKGIEESRVTYKGFGSSQPLFPIPEKDEAQRAANRRVEILITGY
ncbi:MAG: OmpA family protein [Flavobacterium sp.]|nr:OmpA family protein [Flavobacterium sp.]